jgi:putative nucleotidyltransferase with HDIG domain
MMPDFEINKIQVDDVIKKIKDLPILPEVAQELMSSLDNESADLKKINEKIAIDHSLTAKILRLANSSHFGTNSRVVTIQQATALLGVNNIKNVIRMTLMSSSFPTPSCPGFDFKAFWRHSIATAICAELISRTLHMKHDFAFTGGLLHDIGRLVMATYFPQEYAQVIQYQQSCDCSMIEAERSIMHIDHTETGLALAQHWHFSEAVQDTIRGHHSPDIYGINSLASIVHVANAIVHGLDLSGEENDLIPLLSDQAWDTLALTEADYKRIFNETEMRFEAINQILI